MCDVPFTIAICNTYNAVYDNAIYSNTLITRTDLPFLCSLLSSFLNNFNIEGDIPVVHITILFNLL